MQKKNYLLLCVLLSTALISCGTTNNSEASSNPSEQTTSSDVSTSTPSESSTTSDSSVPSSTSTPTSSSTPSTSTNSSSSYVVDESVDFSKMLSDTIDLERTSSLPAYTPQTFDVSTYTTSKTNLSDGVDLIKVDYSLKNGNKIWPKVIEVDLSKANIVAGSNDNTTDQNLYKTRTLPITQATAWERDNQGKQFIAVTNADFFGSTVVNAFAKDNVVLKASHNFQKNSDGALEDVPISKPMLFGVSSAGAKIAPITNESDYETNLQGYIMQGSIIAFNHEGVAQLKTSFPQENGVIKQGMSVLTSKKSFNIQSQNKVYLFKKIQKDQTPDGDVRGCIIEDVSGVSKVTISDDDFGYIVVGYKTKFEYNVGDYFMASKNIIGSQDGKWLGFNTILGCRQSLVENGTIPATVAKEDSNGAQSRVPRTAVGIKPDGKVVIVSIEDIHYGSKNWQATCSGLTLPQLADFMRYYGCYVAANFDGGGSSQLITKAKGGEATVQTRSSDTGSDKVNSSRTVINTIIVTTK